VPPAAGVNSSIHDMALWLVAQTGHRQDVLTQAMLDATHQPQVVTPGSWS
jgi:beta-lactamase class C